MLKQKYMERNKIASIGYVNLNNRMQYISAKRV